jgi:hypothetical protein
MCFTCSMCYVAGDVLVILDLHADNSLFEAGVAREVNYMPLCWLYVLYIRSNHIKSIHFLCCRIPVMHAQRVFPFSFSFWHLFVDLIMPCFD